MPVDAVVVGAPSPALVDQLAAYGVRQVHALTGAGVRGVLRGGWASGLLSVREAAGSVVVLAAGTPRGNEVMAHVAARAGVAMAANVLSFDGLSPFIVTRQVVGGAALEEMLLAERPAVFTVAGHAVEAAPAERPGPAEVVVETPEVAAADLVARVVSSEEPEPDQSGALKSARVVVGAGRGAGSADGFADLLELTSLLGGSLGVSRVVTSLGWRPHHEQVGQTGSRISPDLYIPCGISGAIQHWAGCSSAKHILAINTDAEAPDGDPRDVRRDRRPARGRPGDQRGDQRRRGVSRCRPRGATYPGLREGGRDATGARAHDDGDWPARWRSAAAGMRTATPRGRRRTPRRRRHAAGAPTAAPAARARRTRCDPPGPRTGVLAPADIVVNGSETLPTTTGRADQAARRRHRRRADLAGAGADREPGAQRRRRRPRDVPQLGHRRRRARRPTTVWDRVAGGELALRPPLQKRGAARRRGLPRGSAAPRTRPAVHVGAYAQRSPLIDAVVNETWIDDPRHDARTTRCWSAPAAPRPTRCASRSSGSCAAPTRRCR